ncbi:MAG: excinuclease ABC subunit UvrA [Anaerolineales bacterium]|nr:MAG: excinuclease ABC subunit UvrA [Anaerolineales bacterium]
MFPVRLHENLSYYASQSLLSSPGAYSSMFDSLPDEPAALIRIIQGVLIHKLVADFYHVEVSSEQRAEQHLRSVEQRLKRLAELDPAPLTVARQPADRQVGVCRDFALLFVSMLRHKNIPARMRVGFAPYLAPGTLYKGDHWISEYWDGEQWILADPQIDDVQRKNIGITVDTLNLRRDTDFYLASTAWQLCRAGKARSDLFRFSGKWKGMPCIRGNLLHDFQALNKIELSPWDYWDDLGLKAETRLTVDDKALLDRIASLTGNVDANFDEIQALFEDLPRTRQIFSKLQLLGYIKELQPNRKVELQPSESQRLAAMVSPEIASQQKPQVEVLPYEIPSDSPLGTHLDLHRQDSFPPGMGDIIVRGARQHNLKHIDVRIPRNKFVVITGVSGSGKSSLAFDTIYAEGQRRYVESLSSYARQFMEQMEKPQVDQITGLSPAIAIEQKALTRNPRSTVGTVTEVLDYLRVLYARLGIPHCPQCGRAVQPQSAQQIADQLAKLPQGKRFQLLAPMARNRKGTFQAALREAQRQGYGRVRIDGEAHEIAQVLKTDTILLDKNKKHNLELVVDRLEIPARDEPVEDFRLRLVDSVETCLKAGGGLVLILLDDGQEILLSEKNACPVCEISFAELQPQIFSFNSPLGMCDECNGLGVKLQVDPELIIEHPERSLLDGASRWYRDLRKKGEGAWQVSNLTSIARHYEVDLEVPWNQQPEEFRQAILYGTGGKRIHFKFEVENDYGNWHGESERDVKGIIFHINRLFRQTRSEYTRRWYASFMSQQPCPKCGGERLCPEARYVTVADKRLPELTSFSIAAIHDWICSLPGQLSEEQLQVGSELIEEIRQRLAFIRNVGLHYLTLDRPAPTLSGGEGQRIRLAAQIGSGLVGVLYILDEPSIGLHPRDHRALLDTLIHLRDLGNTVLVVEHDAATMHNADWIIDLGPGPGILGGEVVSAGSLEDIIADPASLTGRYLSGELQVSAPNGRHRRTHAGYLMVRGARLHNLKSIDVSFPLGALTCVTGVSGSGKSSLIAQTLYPALMRALHSSPTVPGAHDAIDGLELVDKVINVTQEPIGRTPRSNPGTYVGALDEIRRVFASTPAARALGYGAGRFSFNVKGGRCEACAGYGFKKVEMHFLPDVWVTCKECGGRRFNRQTLSITYKGANIADVLDMDVQQALEFFASHPDIACILQTLHDVGMDYVKLGQSALTLSGGEAQRVKLAKELSRASTGHTLYILDEPTTGLHFADIQRLLDVLHRLTDAGNTVIIIEHNLDVIKTADWIIDLGPEGGDTGGYIVAEGTPEQVATVDASFTGQFLKDILRITH